MPGGTSVTHRDSDYLASGTHKGANGASVLRDKNADFKSCGVRVGLYIENETGATNSTVASVTEDEITTVDSITWDRNQTYNIYKTATKNSFISSEWTDVSRGWKTDKKELKDGWREDDVDIDDRGRKDIFGPGQPEKNY